MWISNTNKGKNIFRPSKITKKSKRKNNNDYNTKVWIKGEHNLIEKPIHTEEKIIVLIDEGHRTQYKFNAESMRVALPNAVFFAFTGTPIDKKDRSTYRVFGPLLDRYSFEESKAGRCNPSYSI